MSQNGRKSRSCHICLNRGSTDNFLCYGVLKTIQNVQFNRALGRTLWHLTSDIWAFIFYQNVQNHVLIFANVVTVNALMTPERKILYAKNYLRDEN